MPKKNKPVNEDGVESLKKKILKASGIELTQDFAYSLLATYINEHSKKNFPPPKDKSGKIIQQKETISMDTLRRYWGDKSSNKIKKPEEKMKPNIGKLSLIAQALKYKDWDTFCDKNGFTTPDAIEATLDAIEKAFNSMDYFNFSSLLIGEVIFIGWHGKKYCRLKRIQEEDFEDDSFEVIESYGMRSEVGRKFSTSGFKLAPVLNKAIFPEVIILPRYEYQTELWEYLDNLKKLEDFDIQTCPPELLL